jgi:rhombotail lipoprotein
MRFLLAISAAILLAGCALKPAKSPYAEEAGGIPAAQFSDARTVAEIRKLKPQAALPLKVAMVPPPSGLSKRERELIEELEKKLVDLGFLKSLDVVPAALRPVCGYKSESGCFINEARAAGARLGADAVLFLGSSSNTESYVNFFSVLNLTIIGMWIAPAHHRDSHVVYEASLVDIDNGYLYAVAEGYGESSVVRPYMYVEFQTGQDEARENALIKLTEKLYRVAKEKVAEQNAPQMRTQPPSAAGS